MTADAGRLVSVVIPTLNRAPLLEAALDAVLAQTHRELEVVVVDDGSTDRTSRVVAAAARRDSRVRGLRHDVSRGAAAARNVGVEESRGSYLLFEDDDCRGAPARIERLLAALESSPEAAYAYCWMKTRTVTGETVLKGTQGPWAIGTPYALIRRAAFEAVGGFDPSLPRLQDFDLWTRILARSAAVEVPEVLFETVRDGSGISASTDRLLEAAGLLLEKYRGADLPPGHLATLHRLVGGRLMVERRRKEALVHLRRAARLQPGSARSLAALAAASLGHGVYARLVDLQAWLASRGKPDLRARTPE